MVAREGWAPVGENPDQLAAIEVTLDLLLREIRQPQTLQAAFIKSAAVLNISWPSTRTRRSRPPLSNSQA